MKNSKSRKPRKDDPIVALRRHHNPTPEVIAKIAFEPCRTCGARAGQNGHDVHAMTFGLPGKDLEHVMFALCHECNRSQSWPVQYRAKIEAMARRNSARAPNVACNDRLN